MAITQTAREEIENWFNTFIGICTRLAVFGGSLSHKAKSILAEKMQELWAGS